MTTAAPTPSFALDAETFNRIHPKEYLRRFVSEGIRPDGRTPESCRPTNVLNAPVSTATASSIAHLGATSVICAIKAEIAEPKALSPTQGWVVPNIELPPVSASSIRAGLPTPIATEANAELARLFNECKIMELDQLCVSAGEAVWCLWVDLVVISFDGNLWDAALIALTTALKNLRLPKATFEDGVVRADPRQLTQVDIKYFPTSLTLGYFDSYLLADPTEDEAQHMSPMITITVLNDVKNGVQILGSVKISSVDRTDIQVTDDVLRKCIAQAKSRSKEIMSIVGNMN